MMSAVTRFVFVQQDQLLDVEVKIDGVLSGEMQAETGRTVIPDSVFANALRKVQQYVGGVQPPSILVEPTPPSVTMEMLQRLQKKGNKTY